MSYRSGQQFEAMASLRHEPGRATINEIVECPLDGSRLRVPAGRKRLLVTCPSCKYKFIVNTDPDAGAAAVKQEVPKRFEWMLQAKVFSAACLVLVLLALGVVAWRRHIPFPSSGPGMIASDSRPSALPASKTINDGFVPDNNQNSVVPPASEGVCPAVPIPSTSDPGQAKRKSKPIELTSSDVDFDHWLVRQLDRCQREHDLSRIEPRRGMGNWRSSTAHRTMRA